MNPRKRHWLRYGNTYILLELWEDELLPEWQVVGYVIKRQIYRIYKPQWQARWTHSGHDDLIDSRMRLRDAKFALENRLNVERGYVQPITEPGRA